MKTRFISLAVISVAAATLFTTSCVKEDFRNGASTGKVIIAVNTDNAVDTKSGSTTKMLEMVELESDGATLFLSGTESLYNENPFTGRMATKGSIVTTDSINVAGQQFKVTVLNNNGIYTTVNGSEAKNVVAQYDPDGVETKWPLLTEVDWPDVAPKSLDFWAYYDAKSYATPSSSQYNRYSYAGPSTGNEGMDASLMSDFLVANTVGATQNNVAIHFFHALSAVRFNVDASGFRENGWTDEDGYHDSYNSIKVRVSGVYKSGDALYDANETDKFHWDYTGCDRDGVYEQVLFDRSKAGQPGFDDDGYAILTNRTMFIVPQVVGPGSGTLFTFTIVDSSNHETVLSADNVGTTLWKPGYIYNYNVGKDKYGNVGVEVREGEADEYQNLEAKEDVRFEITKSSAVYLRAAIVANWCASNGKIYRAYGSNEFNTTSNWIKGTDGLYYLNHPVLGHSESENFIDKFEPTVSAPDDAPYPLHLEMNILVQAISYDIKSGDEGRAEWAWGEPFKSMLGATGGISTELQ